MEAIHIHSDQFSNVHRFLIIYLVCPFVALLKAMYIYIMPKMWTLFCLVKTKTHSYLNLWCVYAARERVSSWGIRVPASAASN